MEGTVTYKGERPYARQYDETALPEQQRAEKRTRTFLFVTSNKLIDAKQIIAHNKVPKIGAEHPDHPKCKCIHRRARCLRESQKLWEVDCDYESSVLPPPKISYGTDKREVVAKAAIGNPFSQNEVRNIAITTSAKEPFDPPPTIPQSRPLITVVKFVENFNPITQEEFVDRVNQTDVSIKGVKYKPGQLRVMDFRAEEELLGAKTVWRLTLVLLVDREGHKLREFDYGTYYYNSTADAIDGKKTSFLDKNEQKVKGRLNGKGYKLVDKDDDDVFLDFYVYFSANFNELDRLK